MNKDLRNSLISASLSFAEYAFSSIDVEYIEATNYLVAFSKNFIYNESIQSDESLYSYTILDREKRTDKIIHVEIKPLFDDLNIVFKNNYNGKELSLLNQFSDFKQTIIHFFKTRSITVNQKNL